MCQWLHLVKTKRDTQGFVIPLQSLHYLPFSSPIRFFCNSKYICHPWKPFCLVLELPWFLRSSMPFSCPYSDPSTHPLMTGAQSSNYCLFPFLYLMLREGYINLPGSLLGIEATVLYNPCPAFLLTALSPLRSIASCIRRSWKDTSSSVKANSLTVVCLNDRKLGQHAQGPGIDSQHGNRTETNQQQLTHRNL